MPLTDTLYSETANAWFHYANHICQLGVADAYLPQEHARAGTRQAVARAAELGQVSRSRWSRRQLHELQNEANLREVIHAHAGTRQAVARAAELGQASRARWSHRQLHELQNEAHLREVVHDTKLRGAIMSFWVGSMRFCRDECWSPV